MSEPIIPYYVLKGRVEQLEKELREARKLLATRVEASRLDEAMNAHARQQANYIQLCEAVMGEGCTTSDCKDVVPTANRHREASHNLNQICIALGVPYAS